MSKDCTIQDVFHRFYSSFESTHSISPAQRKAAYHIMNCKTGAFGVNVSVCEDCGCISVHYNSCRDRCCPMCQEFPKEKWVDARREDLLDAPYFHVVFRVPGELNPIIYSLSLIHILFSGLIQTVSLIHDFCSSDQWFASGFLQIPLYSGHPCHIDYALPTNGYA